MAILGKDIHVVGVVEIARRLDLERFFIEVGREYDLAREALSIFCVLGCHCPGLRIETVWNAPTFPEPVRVRSEIPGLEPNDRRNDLYSACRFRVRAVEVMLCQAVDQSVTSENESQRFNDR